MKKTAIYQRKRAGDSAGYNKWIQAPLWLKGFGASVGICVVLYVLNMMVGEVSPGSRWGLGYGIAASVLFLGAFVYAARRKAIRLKPLHRAWYYLQFHVYGGTLFLVLMLLHTNFSLPQGVLTWWLWALSFWIVLTGFLGNILQKWIPTVLNASLSTEVNYNRIPELIDDIQKKAGKVVDESGAQVKTFFNQKLKSKLEARQFRWRYFVDVIGTIRKERIPFTYLGKYLDDAEKERLDRLEEIYISKLEIDAHYTLQKALRFWLILHVPVALLILALMVLHVFTVIYY